MNLPCMTLLTIMTDISPFTFFKFYFYLQLIYNIMLVSGVQPSD